MFLEDLKKMCFPIFDLEYDCMSEVDSRVIITILILFQKQKYNLLLRIFNIFIYSNQLNLGFHIMRIP